MFFDADDVASRDASDRRHLRNPRVDHVDARTTDRDQNARGVLKAL